MMFTCKRVVLIVAEAVKHFVSFTILVLSRFIYVLKNQKILNEIKLQLQHSFESSILSEFQIVSAL